MKKLLLTLPLLILSLLTNASEVEMADAMRADGKIYIVVAVLVSILLGLIALIIRTDFKVSQIEKRLKSK